MARKAGAKQKVDRGEAQPRTKLRRKEYERELATPQAELVAMQEWVQEWVKASGVKICVVFEGRGTAGKGGTTKRITERVSPGVERAMVDSGIILLKYWLEVSAQQQTRRLRNRIDDPRKVWKLSAMDLKSHSRWYDYSRARDTMFAATDTEWAPWHVAHTDDNKRGRLNVISHLLSQVPYEPLKPQEATLPKRQKPGGYREPDLSPRSIPTPF